MNLANLSLRRRVCAACAFALAITMNPARVHAIGAMLDGTQFQASGNFYSINPSTGSTTTIGNTNNFTSGMDYRRSNGVLFGSSSNLQTINIKTGLATNVAQLPDLMRSIAFSPTDQLYAVNNSSPKTLFRLDATTGSTLASVQITGTTIAGEINGIDFGPDGTLYGVGFGLYSLNPLSGAATRITPPGAYITGGGGLLFHDIDYGFDGVLRGLTIDSSGANSMLYTINTSTGLGTLVGATGLSLSGLASIPTPEPSTLVLATAVVLVVAAAYLRRHYLLKNRASSWAIPRAV